MERGFSESLERRDQLDQAVLEDLPGSVGRRILVCSYFDCLFDLRKIRYRGSDCLKCRRERRLGGVVSAGWAEKPCTERAVPTSTVLADKLLPHRVGGLWWNQDR